MTQLALEYTKLVFEVAHTFEPKNCPHLYVNSQVPPKKISIHIQDYEVSQPK